MWKPSLPGEGVRPGRTCKRKWLFPKKEAGAQRVSSSRVFVPTVSRTSVDGSRAAGRLPAGSPTARYRVQFAW